MRIKVEFELEIDSDISFEDISDKLINKGLEAENFSLYWNPYN